VTGDLGALHALQSGLVRELALQNLSPDHERFTPHITLARAKDPRGDPELGHAADALRGKDFGELSVCEVSLFSSHLGADGMRYRLLAAHRLSSGRERGDKKVMPNAFPKTGFQ